MRTRSLVSRRARRSRPTALLICPGALAALLLLAGCKKKPANEAEGEAAAAAAEEEVRPVYDEKGPPVPIASRLCRALHALPEERRAQCCASGPGIVLADECVRLVSAALRSKAIALQPARVDACASALERATAGCEWVGPFGAVFPPECSGLFAGQRREGEVCRSSLECQGTLLCTGAGPTDKGRCAPAGGTGASCSTAVDTLATYARQDVDRLHPQCKGYCNRHRCAELAAPGKGCKSSLQCGPERHCAAGKCAEGLARAGEECSGGDCEVRLRCLRGRCFAPLAEGASCSSDFECRGGCLRTDAGARCGPRCDLR